LEFAGEDGASWVEDEVERWSEEICGLLAEGGAHAALDAIAVDGFAEDFGDGEADAHASGWGRGWLGGEKEGAKGSAAFAAVFIDALVVGVLFEEDGELGGHGLIVAENARFSELDVGRLEQLRRG
jgi:hypothetical protein